MCSLFDRLKQIIIHFNLFSNESEDKKIIFYQRLSTRIFIISFLISSIIILIYVSLSKQTTTVTIEYPSETTIEYLYINYGNTLNCPCTQISIPYRYLVQHNISYHQICSSEFVKEEWIDKIYQANSTYVWPLDVRTIASAFFQNLRSFCFLSNQTVANALFSFASQSIITKQALSPAQFHSQVQSSSKFVRNTTWRNFYYSHFTTREIMNCNQLISGLGTNVLWKLHRTSARSEMFLTSIIYGSTSSYGGGCLCHMSQSCSEPSGLFPDVRYTTQNLYSEKMYNGSIGATMISGWRGGCLPLQSLLQSTLECFYNLTCIHILTGTNDRMIQALDPNREKYRISTRVLTLLNELFVDEWIWTISYKNYIDKCAPLLCTYSYTHRNNLMYIAITVFGLIGGLSSGLRVFVKEIILRLLIWNLKRKRRRQNALYITDGSNVRKDQQPFKQHLRIAVQRTRNKIVQFNLFSDTVWIRKTKLKRQLWTTRIFVICLLMAFIIRTVYITIEQTTTLVFINFPNQSKYESLLQTYPLSLECPCTNISIEYKEFFIIKPRYHSICSSQFIRYIWYSRLYLNEETLTSDFRVFANALFRLLDALCLSTRQIIISSIDRFSKTPFINYHTIDKNLFNERATAILENFIKTTKREFLDVLELVNSLTSASQFITLANLNSFGYISENLTVFYKQIPFDLGSTSIDSCYCARDLHCEGDAKIYHFNESTGSSSILFKVDGFVLTCYLLDSLLKSSPECLYNLTCVNNFLSFFEDSFIPRRTLNASAETRFQRNTTFQLIINELFVEDWRITYSYPSFFTHCMPSHCSYPMLNRHNLLFIVTSLIALYGGLTVVLELMLPHLVNLIAACIVKSKKRSACNRNQTRLMQPFIVRIRTAAMDFNVFESSSKERLIVREQRVSTRIYIITVIICLIGFILYTSLPEHTNTMKIDEPVEEDFTNLYESYSDTIQCSVSNISIEYDKFISIKYSIHEICQSDFVKKEVINYFFHIFTSPLPSDDFRCQSINYFYLISSLCSLTKTLLNNTLHEFSRTNLINTRMLSRKELSSQMESILFVLNETLSNSLIKSLKLFEDNIQGNQFITLSASNWKFIVRYSGMNDLVRSIPVKRSNCSCATSSSCLEKGKIYMNENETYAIEGIQLGCTPLYSLLSSTLQCLYESQCFKYLIKAFQIPTTLSKLDLNKTRFNLNTTMRKIVENLFIEEWNVSINYSSFYIQSHPKQCFYSYAKRKDLLDISIETLAFYGGLTTACGFIIPLVVKLFFKIKQTFQR